jgi:hypothetical protein
MKKPTNQKIQNNKIKVTINMSIINFTLYIFFVIYAFVKMGFLWGVASIFLPFIPLIHIIAVYIVPNIFK